MGKSFALAFVCLALAGCADARQEGPPRFIVFFVGASTALTPDGQTIVKKAATKIAATRPNSVLISAGVSAGANTELSQPRFDAVRLALIEGGVSQDLIARSAIPGPQLTGTGTKAIPGDQRVEITLLAKGL